MDQVQCCLQCLASCKECLGSPTTTSTAKIPNRTNSANPSITSRVFVRSWFVIADLRGSVDPHTKQAHYIDSGLWQPAEALKTIEHDAENDERKALDELFVSVVLRPAPHRPRVRQASP